MRSIYRYLKAFLAVAIAMTAITWPVLASAARRDGTLTIQVVDEQTGKPIAVRMELRDGRGRPVRPRAEGVVTHGDYFVFEGMVDLELRKGPYKFVIEAGPEYQTRPGHFTIERHAEDQTEVVLRRRVDMQAEGWWAGDLDVHQRPTQMPLLMAASGVDIAPIVTTVNERGKCQHLKIKSAASRPGVTAPLFEPSGMLDHRRGGGLLFHSPESLDVCSATDGDSSVEVLTRAAEADVIALTPFAWDLPLWIATGRLDAIQTIHRHALIDDVVDNEGWGRSRDKTLFRGKTGNGRYSEMIYHHVLNCGLQIPPAAGSGSGANDNPVGTNRVYVRCGEDFSRERWFAGLREGKVVVTNGPLLRTTVEGHAPGYVFELDAGESRDFQIGLNLTFYEKAPVEYLEIVKNGQVEYEIRLDELAKKQGRLPTLTFDEGGWFLVRAMNSNTKNYQYASTGPYYVRSNYQPRISRTSVKYFLDWLDDAAEQFADNGAVVADIEAARHFWQDLFDRATSE